MPLFTSLVSRGAFFLAILSASCFAVPNSACGQQTETPQRVEAEDDEAARLGVDKLFGLTRLRGFGRQPNFSADGKLLIGCGAWKFKFLDVATGQTREVPMTSSPDALGNFALSPDGSRVLIDGNDGAFSVWNTATGDALFKGPGDFGSLHGMAWSPDGSKIVLGHWQGAIKVWDVAAGEEIVSHVRNVNGAVDDAAWSPGGSLYACGGSDESNPLLIFDAESHQRLQQIDLGMDRSAGFAGIVFLSEDEVLACGAKFREVNGIARKYSVISIWNPRSGKLIKTLDQAETLGKPEAVCLTPDQKQVVVKSGGTVRFFDLQTGEVTRNLEGLPVGQYSSGIAVSPDGSKIAYGGKLVKLIDIETNAWLHKSAADGHDGSAFCARSPDGTLLVTASNDGSAIVWDWETCQPVHVFELEKDLSIEAMAWAPNGRQIYILRDRARFQRAGEYKATLLALDPFERTKVFETELRNAHISRDWRIAPSPNGQEIAVSSVELGRNPRIQLTAVEFLNPQTGRRTRTLDLPQLQSPVQSFRYAPDGESFVSTTFTGPHHLQFWNARTGDLLHSEVGCAQGIVSFSADSRRMAGLSSNGEVIIYDVSARKELRRIAIPVIRLQSPFFFPDGRRVGARCPGTTLVDGQERILEGAQPQIRIWDADSAELLNIVTERSFVASSWSITRDGEYILTTVDSAVAARELTTVLDASKVKDQ